MNWTHRKLVAKRGEIARDHAALRYEAMALADTEQRVAAAGPTSFAVKRLDEETQVLIEEALRERGMA